MVADPEFIEVIDPALSKTLVISRDVPDDPCDASVTDMTPQVREAAANFHLKSTNRTGMGRIAIVIYQQGRPIDEIPLQICVACPGKPPLTEVTELNDAANDMLNAADDAPPTDASLYFFDFANGASAGVLAVRAGQAEFKYYPWANADQTVQSMRKSLVENIAPGLSAATTDAHLTRKSVELANLLFPPGNADAARIALENFLLDARKQHEPAPSLFVRVASVDNREPVVVPIGLVAMKNVKDGTGFLGKYASIVMPLSVQRYAKFDECSTQVMAVMPKRNGGNDALNTARTAMGSAADRWEHSAGELEWSSTAKLGEWMATGPRIPNPTVLFMLTHHFNDSIWINVNEPVGSNAVKDIKFLQPSWAVLNGCGTDQSRVSGDGFVRLLNAAGMQAVIATHSEVPAALAGAYFACMDEALSKAPANESYRLGDAHFAATDCLWKKEQVPAANGVPAVRWGANALKYTLLGNPNLKVCRIQ
jgi:hypothetical protein